MIKKGNLISEGKAKSLFETEKYEELLMVYRDDTSAFDGKKKEAIQPTIDLTCCCKKDLDINFKVILSFFLFIIIFSIVLIGDFAPQDEDLKVEKS